MSQSETAATDLRAAAESFSSLSHDSDSYIHMIIICVKEQGEETRGREEAGRGEEKVKEERGTKERRGTERGT